MEPVLQISNLCKEYRITHLEHSRYLSLRDEIWYKLRRIFSNKPSHDVSRQEFFWALEDINLSVNHGECIGIIGRNGSGKSTLLKILSRITPPTKGNIILRGKVASLLEVGTGFHPELTGRENVYLNGSILGLKKAEIDRQFDAIIDFSGMEKFLDTPLKHYSSGMQMRLAFSVAAHLNADILLIDEVLAVGDITFQKKCLRKMDDVSKSGRTVLFVSHNLQAVQQLCSRSILLDEGKMIASGHTDNVIDTYLGKAFNNDKVPIIADPRKTCAITDYEITGDGDAGFITSEGACRFIVRVNSNEGKKNVQVAFGINDKFNNRVFTVFTRYFNEPVTLTPGINTIECYVPSLPLKPGVYDVHIFIGDEFHAFDYFEGGAYFVVRPGKSSISFVPTDSQGSLIISQEWRKTND